MHILIQKLQCLRPTAAPLLANFDAISILKVSDDLHQAVREFQTRRASKLLTATNKDFKLHAVGTRVWVQTPDKIQTKAKDTLQWQCSATILHAYPNFSYKIQWITAGFTERAGSMASGTYHHRLLRPIPDHITDSKLLADYLSHQGAGASMVHGEDFDEVEAIIAQRTSNDSVEFLVRWLGLPILASSWHSE
jgi:hypothetical protein